MSWGWKHGYTSHGKLPFGHLCSSPAAKETSPMLCLHPTVTIPDTGPGEEGSLNSLFRWLTLQSCYKKVLLWKNVWAVTAVRSSKWHIIQTLGPVFHQHLQYWVEYWLQSWSWNKNFFESDLTTTEDQPCSLPLRQLCQKKATPLKFPQSALVEELSAWNTGMKSESSAFSVSG